MPNVMRRAIMLTSAAAFAPVVRRAHAQSASTASPPSEAVIKDPSYPFSLPPLPYAFGANEPHIDAQTMELHHDRHHAAYVTNLNAAVKDYPQVAAMPLTRMLARLGELPEAIRTTVRNNGGGHANHSMFWPVMGGRGGEPDGTLAAAIRRDFGSFDQLKESFGKAGAGQFGSGWVMVLVDRSGALSLATRANQDSPLMDGKRVLFGNDVWEHAYYLKYQNRRPAYLAAWWNVINWPAVAARYQATHEGGLAL